MYNLKDCIFESQAISRVRVGNTIFYSKNLKGGKAEIFRQNLGCLANFLSLSNSKTVEDTQLSVCGGGRNV